MNEIIIALISAAAGGLVTLLTTSLLDHRKEKREDRIEARKERLAIFQSRPEVAIIDYKNYIGRTGYGIKQKCDIEVFVAKIANVQTTGKKKRDIVEAYYQEDHLDPRKWCCTIYTLKNAGKTDISRLDLICHAQRTTCIFPCNYAKELADAHSLCYWECYDKKIRVGETVTLKMCYHQDCVITGTFSAIMSIGMEDDNGHWWTQPFFAPDNKLYDSRQTTHEEYWREIRTDIAEECFKKPWLW